MVTAHFDGTTLTLQGHAGSAPFGQDLVCAAVSGLVYALTGRLTELAAMGAFEKPPVCRLEAGKARIAVFPKQSHSAVVMEDFRLVQKGLCLLAEQYPRYVKVGQSDIPLPDQLEKG